MKKLITPLLFLFVLNPGFAEEADSIYAQSDTSAFTEMFKKLEEIEKSYQKGEVDLNSGLASLKVPAGYKFLNAELSNYVLSDLWGNPPNPSTLGLLFPDSIGPLSDGLTYVVELSYSEEGYIEDDDAKDIDYDELLQTMKDDAVEENKERARLGYSTYQLIGWASSPFYDEENKKLHWAKELKFNQDSLNTLNYNVRILGRKGYINMNVIGPMEVLPQVKKDINILLASTEFKEGNKYSDFDPDIDEVAAYGIGGLIAGKVLAKAGFFAVLAKFGKFILFGLIAAGGAAWRYITGRKKQDETPGSGPEIRA